LSSATPTAVLLATAPAGTSGPAAALPWEGTTLLARLTGQLRSLGVDDIRVLARPADAAALGAEASADLAADARRVGEIARAATGDVIVLPGDLLTQREALAGLLADPRIASGILAGQAPLGRLFTFPARQQRGRIVSASSPFHAVHRPNTRFLSVVRVGPADHPALAAVCDELATLLDGGPPPSWEAQLHEREGRWRVGLHSALQRELRGDGEEAAPADGATEADVDEAVDPWALELDAGRLAQAERRRAAAREDLASLLLVGLVRAGVHLRFQNVRKLFWARPLSQEDLDLAAERIGDFDEDRVLLQSAVKASDGFFTTFFVSPYSKYIARWCARHGFTPNQVTTVSLGIGVLAAAAFATGERWGLVAGAILLQLAFTTDCVDGQLARYTRTFSKLGAWLDSVFDRAKEYVVFAGLAIGASRAGDPVWALAGAALALQTARHASDFAWGATQQQNIEGLRHPRLAQPDDLARAAARRGGAAAPRGEETPAAAPGPSRSRSPAELALSAWKRLDRLPGVRWMKKMVAFPIGERFATISLTAALFSPRTTFTVFLIWGGGAALYQHAGRILRTIAR
jgi:hypothetical protein